MTVTRQPDGPRGAARIGGETLLSKLWQGKRTTRNDFGSTHRHCRRRQHRMFRRRHARSGGASRRNVGATARDGCDRSQWPASIFADAGAVLVTVKSTDTAAIADVIASHAPADAVIVSLQNGVSNVPVLRARLPGHRVLGGMVPFNVVAHGKGRFHRATSGDIIIERDHAGTAAQLSVPGLKVRSTMDIAGVQWGKLLVNLNNALNALGDLPLRQQLARRSWRRLFADQMAEGLQVIRAEGIRPVSSTPIPAGWMPHLLRLPDAVFAALLGSTMRIDADARSSMWEDLQRGRRTEIDYLQGAIIAIAERRGIQVPLSRRVVTLIKQAEAAGKGSPGLTPQQIRAE